MSKPNRTVTVHQPQTFHLLPLSHHWGSCPFHRSLIPVPRGQSIPPWFFLRRGPAMSGARPGHGAPSLDSRRGFDRLLSSSDEGSHPGTSPWVRREEAEQTLMEKKNQKIETLRLSTPNIIQTQKYVQDFQNKFHTDVFVQVF